MKKLLIPMLVLLAPLMTFAASLEPPTDDTTLTEVIVRIAGGLVALMAVGGVFMFVYGGVMMLTAGGNEKQIVQAKNILRWTVYGILTVLLSVSLVQFIFALFGFETTSSLNIPGLTGAPLQEVAVNTIQFVLGLLGIAGVAILVWGGYTWLTAGGNEQQIDKAKGIIRSAVIGLLIIILSWSAIRFVLRTGEEVTSANGLATTGAPRGTDAVLTPTHELRHTEEA